MQSWTPLERENGSSQAVALLDPRVLCAATRVEKPWGYEVLWAKTAHYAGKILHIKAGHRLSLQYHERKEETILLHSGHMLLVFEDDAGVLRELSLRPGQAHHIPRRRRHRMVAVEDCEVFEVSTPFLDDVCRVEDDYGRSH